MPLYEYRCEHDHLFEHLVRMDERENIQECPVCEGDAFLIMSPARFKLDGCDPAYPTAYRQWEKKRKQKMALEQRNEP